MVRFRRAPALLSLLVVAACGEELVLEEQDVVEDEPAAAEPEEPAPLAPMEPIVVEPEVLELWEDPARGPPYPIVLVHGFSGFTDLGPLDYFFQVVDELSAEGHVVYAPALPPYNGSDDRARVLARVIDDVLAETHKRKVHLIAHSQGGVDSRRVVAGLGYADKVASLTTIASPHRGTDLADVAKSAPDGVLNPAGQFLGWLLGLLDHPPSDGDWASDEGGDPWTPEMVDAVEQLSTDGMAAFNEQHPDPEGLPIFSVVGYSNLRAAPDYCEDGVLFERTGRVDPVDPLLVSTGLILSGASLFNPRANDGIVPSDSMVWGTLLGCVPADHFDEVGQIGDLIPHVMSGFDHLDMFRRLIDNARSVEALEE